MPGPALPQSFEAVVLPYLDAGYTLARWLTRGRGDAEDVVQEALVRALTYFPGFRGERYQVNRHECPKFECDSF